MKKLGYLCFSIILGAILIFASGLILPKHESLALSGEDVFCEDDIAGKIDIIGADNSNFLNIESITGEKNGTPYDPKSHDFASGYAITPKSDQYNQVLNWSAAIERFNMTDQESVYVWIYIPCSPTSNYYTLTLSLESSGTKKLVWTFDSDKLSSMLITSRSKMKKGWCLFELRAAAADTPIREPELSGTEFSVFRISYQAIEMQEGGFDQSFAVKVSNSKLSFYHMFLGVSSSASGGIAFQQDYSIYSFKTTYLATGEQHYVGESLTVNRQDMFEQFIIGKYDLLSSNFSDFSWELEYAVGEYEPIAIQFGEKIQFSLSGMYSLVIRVRERNQVLNDLGIASLGHENVCQIQLNFSSVVFTIGNFSNSTYTFQVSEQQVIPFKMNEHFIKTDGEYRIIVSNDDYAEVIGTRTVEDTIYITVKAKRSGKATISVSARGRKAGSDEIKTFTESTELFINSSAPDNRWKIILLWIILGIYVVGFVCILIISLVKNRKNSVK